MHQDLNNILIFATNVRNDQDKLRASILLNQQTAIQKWSIDQEDIDCVLRIESDTLQAHQIISLFEKQSFTCILLE